ncbi:MAG: hypothetical protein WA908_09725 [Pontixanthobacter sp.]
MKTTIAALATGLMCSVAIPAHAQSVRSSVGVSASGSGSTNPFLVPDGEAAGAVTISVDPQIFIEDERGRTSLRGNVRYSQYTNRYGGDEAASLTANTSYAIDERTQASAGAFFSTSRTPLRDSLSTGLGGLLLEDGIDNFDVPFLDPAIIGARTRSIRFGAEASASYSLDSTSTIGGGIVSTFNEFDGPGIDFRDVSGRLSYSRRLSERATLSLVGGVSHVDYEGAFGDSLLLTPSVELSLQLSEASSLSAGVGVSYVDSETSTGSDDSFVVSGNAQYCNRGRTGALCLGASHSARPNAFGTISRVTAFNANYDMQLSETDRLSFGAQYSRTGNNITDAFFPVDDTVVGGDVLGDDHSIAFSDDRDLIGATARYSRQVNDRLSLFATPGFILITDDEDNDETNFELNVGVTYTFGAR